MIAHPGDGSSILVGLGEAFPWVALKSKRMTGQICQLQPFNEFRFDDCIAYLSSTHNRALTVYEIMKLHVMIDVYHTLDRGKPAIGGVIWPFTNGPVSRSSKGRVAIWRKKYETTAQMPDGFLIIDEGDRLSIKATRVPDEDDFSVAEISAMDRAWKDVVELLDEKGFEASQAFFHQDSFIGQAWKNARNRGQSLDWMEIVDEYDKAHPGEDHSKIKIMLQI